ncbi:MAG: undecaprenyl-diphosphate phosphatase [Myxococcota bacterium]|jgi:undecaprenyl-diphosphatase|nr:undecaprenyl-diphosphate phosphatase [Myxococcota bacterium]
MGELLSVAILAIVQGLAEFLPISSSGHLVLLHALFSFDEGGLLLDVMLHVGTLFAVLWVYRRDLQHLLLSTCRALSHFHRVGWRSSLRRGEATSLDPDSHSAIVFFSQLLLATVFTGIIGFVLKDSVETVFRTPVLVGAALLVNALILFVAPRRVEQSSERSWGKMVVLGVLQGLAVMPGISRSGLTISGALFMGMSAKDAARISFLLSIPAILGALVLHLGELDSVQSAPWGLMLFGATLSALVGVFSLKLLLRMLQNAKFRAFSYYCAVVGAAAVVWGLLS